MGIIIHNNMSKYVISVRRIIQILSCRVVPDLFHVILVSTHVVVDVLDGLDGLGKPIVSTMHLHT
jgi:hypothetical protein